MPETFQSRLDETSTAIFWWVRISGLPYLFCVGEVPSAFMTGLRDNGRPYWEFDGDTYDWLSCLHMPEGWGQVDAQMQPKGGMPQSGGLNFTFRIDDTIDGNITQEESQWLKLLARAIKGRTDGVLTANLGADLIAGGAPNITFLSNAWSGVSGNVNLYLGLETLICDDATNTSTVRGATQRGRFGSKTKQHSFESHSDDESHATGLIVADFPLVWEGRVIELYASLGHWQLTELAANAHLGQFETYSRQDGIDLVTDEPNTKLMDRFVVTNVREGGDLASVVLETAGLDALIDGDILAKVPRATVGLGPGFAWNAHGQLVRVYIGPHNWRFSIVFRGKALTSAPISLTVVDWASITDGDRLTWYYPGGNIQPRAKTTPALAQDFSIGTNAATYLDNLEYFLRNDSYCSGWREHYRVERSNDGRRLVFRFVSAVGTADEAWGMASDDPAGAAFSQADTAPIGMEMLDYRLRYYTGASMGDVPEGIYTPYQLGEYMRQSALEHFYNIGLLPDLVLADLFTPGAPFLRILPDVSTDGSFTNKQVLAFALWGSPPEETSLDVFTRYSGKESFLRDLGFTNDSYFAQGTENGGATKIVATKSPAAFRWPRKDYLAPSRLYLHDMTEWDADNIMLATAHFDDGGVLGAHGIIDGVDVIEYSEGNFTGWVSSWRGAGFYVAVDGDSFFGFGSVDETYIEIPDPAGDKELKLPEFERVVFFRHGISAAKGLLQLLIGGSGSEGALDATYDVGWLSAGMAIHGDYFDLTSFTEHADAGLEKRYWCIRRGDKMRDLLDNECKLSQFQICSDGGVLYLATTRPLAESDEVDAFVIDASNLVTDLENQGIGFDRAENRIVNQIDVQADYNPVTKNTGLKVPLKRADSISSYGAKEPMSLQVRGNPGAVGGLVVARRLANRIFAAYALPYAVVEVYLATPAAWLLKLGSDVVVTSTVLPEERGSGRGVTALPARVFGRSKFYMSAGSGSARYFAKLVLVVRAYSGNRYSRITPSAYAVSYKGGGGSSTTINVQTTFSKAGEDDTEFFAAGMIVTLYSIVDGSTVTKTVLSIPSSTEIEFTSSASIALPALVIWASYDSSTATQQKYVHLSDGVNLGSAGDRSYSYP